MPAIKILKGIRDSGEEQRRRKKKQTDEQREETGGDKTEQVSRSTRKDQFAAHTGELLWRSGPANLFFRCHSSNCSDCVLEF